MVSRMAMFSVRIQAHAAAHFEYDDLLVVGWPDASAVLQSEYTGGDDGRARPVTMHGEIRGEAPSLDEAEQRLGGALANTLPVIAVGANAAIADPLAVAAQGIDLTEPQPFVGYRTPGADDWAPVSNRGSMPPRPRR